MAKGGLISELFSLSLKPPKNVPKTIKVNSCKIRHIGNKLFLLILFEPRGHIMPLTLLPAPPPRIQKAIYTSENDLELA